LDGKALRVPAALVAARGVVTRLELVDPWIGRAFSADNLHAALQAMAFGA
jgi:hypothetical protein